jgi:hypothetical protein
MRNRGNFEHRTSNVQHREMGVMDAFRFFSPLSPALSPLSSDRVASAGEGGAALLTLLVAAPISEGRCFGGGPLRTASPTSYGEFGRLLGEKGGWM